MSIDTGSTEPTNSPPSEGRGKPGGFDRRRFVVGAAVAGSALAGLQQLRANADEPGPGKVRYKAAPAQQRSVKGNTVPAFPGCEGAGKFTTGGRGGKIYEVTTLDEDGAGSLRDAVSKDNRIVVFRVGGTIELTEGLEITGNNITIAGQTAPGDGIQITGNEFKVHADNVIIRYLRVRAGDRLALEIDTMNGRGHRNIVVDHCSVGWGIDECFSLYGNYDVTVTNCIIHEGLAMSDHVKGLHGYGGLWGGQNISYYNNLLIHQGGRNPRFSFTEDMEQRVDYRNNVIFDYGYTSCYGAEWCEGINVVNNYYKPGPDTLASVAPHVIEPYRGGSWFVEGNVIEGHADVSADNRLGIDLAVGGIELLDEPAEFPNPLSKTVSAKRAYQAVLSGVGASIPHYDSVDARLLNELREGTGRLINSQREVGGYPELANGTAPTDSDHDGIPDKWETDNGLDPQDPSDATAIGSGGYAQVETYINSIEPDITDYPTVVITSPAADHVVSNGKSTKAVKITADVTPVKGSKITSVEFYADDQLIGKSTAAPYRATWTKAEVGTWCLSAKVTDDRGAKVQSTAVPIHLNQTSAVKPWTSADIGDVPIPGSARIDSVTGDITITGSGKIRSDNTSSSDTTPTGSLPQADSFHYLYQPISVGAGDTVDIIARIDDVSRNWDANYAGLMFRESLEPDAQFFTAGLMVLRDGLKGHVSRIRSYATAASVSDYPFDGEDDVLDIGPQWIRLLKRGREIEAFLGPDSLQWTRIGYERMVMKKKIFVGLVVDANKQANDIANYATARFHKVAINT